MALNGHINLVRNSATTTSIYSTSIYTSTTAIFAYTHWRDFHELNSRLGHKLQNRCFKCIPNDDHLKDSNSIARCNSVVDIRSAEIKWFHRGQISIYESGMPSVHLITSRPRFVSRNLYKHQTTLFKNPSILLVRKVSIPIVQT